VLGCCWRRHLLLEKSAVVRCVVVMSLHVFGLDVRQWWLCNSLGSSYSMLKLWNCCYSTHMATGEVLAQWARLPSSLARLAFLSARSTTSWGKIGYCVFIWISLNQKKFTYFKKSVNYKHGFQKMVMNLNYLWISKCSWIWKWCANLKMYRLLICTTFNKYSWIKMWKNHENKRHEKEY
jgi:hypothetical protein